jgi:hypothetical protein
VQELFEGLHHWTAYHDGIRQRVSSYYVEPARALIDPMVPDGGLEWFERHATPERILLTNRHHYRHSARYAEAFGCSIHASAPGMHEFTDAPHPVEPFEPGDQPAPGITALEVGAICPDETALHIAHGAGAMAFADGLVRPGGGRLGFVPDFLMGDDPVAVKEGLRRAFRALLDREFDALLFAHGTPLVGGGRRALEEFVGPA